MYPGKLRLSFTPLIGRNPSTRPKKKGVCGRARSLVPAGGIPAPVRLVNHRVANIGQAEVTPNVKHDGRKTIGRKRKLK